MMIVVVSLSSDLKKKHRVASDDPNIEHLIVASRPNGQPIGFVILAGLQGERGGIEFMRLALADKGKGYGLAAAPALARCQRA